MSQKVQRVRGTNDLYGQEMLKYNKIVQTANSVLGNHNFAEIQTPIMEKLEVFARNLGETSDIVNKEMYVLEDKGGEKLALRPEGTAGMARAFVENVWSDDLPLKCFYIGPMFRYERPQKGRYRQFHQLGLEIMGSNSHHSDVEAIVTAQAILQELGLANDIVLQLNSLGDIESRNKHRAILIEYFEKYQNDLSEGSRDKIHKNPLRILDSKVESEQEIIANVPSILTNLNDESKAYFDKVQGALNDVGVAYKIDDTLVRGMDYYAHTVFEFVTDKLGAQATVLGGGRYDYLVKQLGGPDTKSVGWASGMERLMLLLDDIEPENLPVSMLPLGELAEQRCFTLAMQLRKLGHNIDFSYSGNMKKKMKRANKINSQFAIIVGEDELSNNQVLLRNMVSGDQVAVSFDAGAISNALKG